MNIHTIEKLKVYTLGEVVGVKFDPPKEMTIFSTIAMMTVVRKKHFGFDNVDRHRQPFLTTHFVAGHVGTDGRYYLIDLARVNSKRRSVRSKLWK